MSDWDAGAREAARYAQERLMHRHRGALPGARRGVATIFGNDGSPDSPKVRAELERVRTKLGELGIKILGFGTSPDGQSWAMVVRGRRPGTAALERLVWTAWEEGYLPEPQGSG
jgi:hypothetical protein